MIDAECRLIKCLLVSGLYNVVYDVRQISNAATDAGHRRMQFLILGFLYIGSALANFRFFICLLFSVILNYIIQPLIHHMRK